MGELEAEKRMIKFIKNNSNRMFVVYLLAGILFIFLFNGPILLNKVQRQTLNRIKPESFIPLRKYMESSTPMAVENLDDYIFYYTKIAQYIQPPSGDIFGMLGYCYYVSGRRELAKENFEKAYHLDPHYFWYPYNLGLLALRDHDPEKAVSYFEYARTMNKDQTTLTTLGSLQVYMPLIFNKDEDLVFWMARRLDNAIQQNNLLFLYAYDKVQPQKNVWKDPVKGRQFKMLMETDPAVTKLQVF